MSLLCPEMFKHINHTLEDVNDSVDNRETKTRTGPLGGKKRAKFNLLLLKYASLILQTGENPL